MPPSQYIANIITSSTTITSHHHQHSNHHHKNHLNHQEKLAVWEQKQCPGKEYEPTNHECEEFWLKIGASLEVNLTKLEQALEMVMPRYLKAQKGAKRDLL